MDEKDDIADSSELSIPDWTELAESVSRADEAGALAILETLPPGETARCLDRLSEPQRAELIRLVGAENSADLLEHLPELQAAELLGDLPAEEAADIVHELHDDTQADLLGELSTAEADAILEELPSDEADVARHLLDYDPESAGGLMTTEVLRFGEGQTVDEVVNDLRQNREKYTDYEVQYAYVVDVTGGLRGVLRLRDLVLAGHDTPISGMMIPDPLSVRVTAGLDQLVEFFGDHSFLGVPVVDDEGKLEGVLQHRVVREATEKRARNIFLKVSGIIGGEELRSLPLQVRCVRRLAFLTPNIILNMVAASVIALFQDTLQAVIVLAVFLPIISDMSGCSGNQAVAVSIRELALGLIRPTEVWRVFLKESVLGLINGVVLGILLGTIAALWQGNPWLGVVVGSALALNTLLSVVMGGLVPLLMKRLRVDPALASGPILTTVTDMCGFFLVLSFASAMLDRL